MFKRLKKIILLRKQERILNDIKECNEFNLARIKCYHTDDFSEFDKKYPEDSCALARCCPDEEYLRKMQIDDEIIRINKLLYEDTVRIYKEYDKRKTKEDLQKRVKFIEDELKNIKKMIVN
jgi:hypothetical protein